MFLSQTGCDSWRWAETEQIAEEERGASLWVTLPYMGKTLGGSLGWCKPEELEGEVVAGLCLFICLCLYSICHTPSWRNKCVKVCSVLWDNKTGPFLSPLHPLIIYSTRSMRSFVLCGQVRRRSLPCDKNTSATFRPPSVSETVPAWDKVYLFLKPAALAFTLRSQREMITS